MEDDLRSTIESAVTENTPAETSSPAPAPVESSSVSNDTPSTPAEGGTPNAKPSTVSGTDVKTKSDLPSIEEVAGKKTAAPTDELVEEPVEPATGNAPSAPSSRIDRAPQSWKGEAKKLWAELPLTVRQEVIRREKDAANVVQNAAMDRQRVQEMIEVLAPHREQINHFYGGNPIAAVGNLLKAEQMLTKSSPQDRARFVAEMIQQYDVDVGILDAVLSNTPLTDSQNQMGTLERMLEQRLAPVQQFIQSQQNAERQRMQQLERDANLTVEQMQADVTNFPYFDEVRQEMADLIEWNAQRGISLSLDQAYSKAVRMNDSLSQAADSRNSATAATQAALNAHREAQEAKGASLSVAGAPSGTGSTVGNPNDLRSVIAASFTGNGRV